MRKTPNEPHPITREQMRIRRAEAQSLAPGMWLDREGCVTFELSEILAHLGIPESPENRRILERVITDRLAQQFPTARRVVLEEG